MSTTQLLFSEECDSKTALVIGNHEICRVAGSGIHFIEKYRELGVVVTTSVLETGVSLDGYTDAVGLFTRIPLPHRSWVQLVNHMQNPQKITLCAEKKINYRHRVDKSCLLRCSVWRLRYPSVREAYVNIQSEDADVVKSNAVPWEENWEPKLMYLQYGASRASHGVEHTFRAVLKEQSEGIKRYL